MLEAGLTLARLALLIRIKFITIANYCFYIFVSFTMGFQPFAYLKNCVFYCVQMVICGFMPNLFINLFFCEHLSFVTGKEMQ